MRQALLSTRQALLSCGHYEALVAEGDTLALDPRRVDLDVAEFEALLDDGAVPALESAAALYGGEFLEGFRVGEPAFDDWVAAERTRLRERARHGAVRAARPSRRRGRGGARHRDRGAPAARGPHAGDASTAR